MVVGYQVLLTIVGLLALVRSAKRMPGTHARTCEYTHVCLLSWLYAYAGDDSPDKYDRERRGLLHGEKDDEDNE